MEAIRRMSRTTLTVLTGIYIAITLSFGYWLTTDDDKEYLAWAIVTVVGTIIAGLLLMRFVPATESEPDTDNKPAKRGLVLGLASVVTLVGFWTGLPIVLGVPALVLGAEGQARSATQGHGSEATAAVVLSVAALVLCLVASIVG